MLNHLLEQLHNASAPCKLSCWVLTQVSCRLRLPIVWFSWEVSRKGSCDTEVRLGGETPIGPGSGRELLVAALLVAPPCQNIARCEIRTIVLFI